LKQCACHCTQDQVGRGAAVTEAALAGALDAVRGAVLDAFPGGLPPWEPVRRGLEGDADGQARARCRAVFRFMQAWCPAGRFLSGN